MAERVGVEPTVEFPQHSLSRRALSTTQTPLRSVRFILTEAGHQSNGPAALVSRHAEWQERWHAPPVFDVGSAETRC